MSRLLAIKQMYRTYKLGEDFSQFSDEAIVQVRLFNYIALITNLFFVWFFNSYMVKIPIFLLFLHYCYRTYLTEKYIKINYNLKD